MTPLVPRLRRSATTLLRERILLATHVRVAVIGGGVVGCSVLYHLAKRGWTDVALLERAELTSGSTWHAAGGMHTLNGDPSVAALQRYTIELYKELEKIEGSACGVHRPGCIYLASTDQQVDFFRSERAKARVLGLELDFIGLGEAKRLNPLLDMSFFKSAMFDPNDGYVDPSGVTQALAQGARQLGATIVRHCPVQAVRRRAGGEWELQTPGGAYVADYVVNAAGLWAREVGRLFGAELPIVPMEHQYLITNAIPELAALGFEIPVGVDFLGANYFRQERDSLLLGTYEQDCRHWALDGTPPDFGVELLNPDLERLGEELQKAMERIPALATAGVKRVVNGGMVFSPDGNPIVGPLPGLPTAFVAAGCMAGFSQSGGVGLAVANWIVDGEPGMDAFAMDIARYGPFATTPYVLAKTRENYRRRFIIACPNEELSAARPCYTSPLFDCLREQGALFGQVAGWEVPLWFARDRADARETPTFRRSDAFARVGEECRAVRQQVGLFDASSYSKIEVTGAHAALWLDRIIANQVPAVGRLAISPMLTPTGRVLGDVSVLRTDEDRILIIGSPAAETVYLRWLKQHAASGITIRSVSHQFAGVSLSGPHSRDILAMLTSADVSATGLPFLRLKHMTIGLAATLVARVSYTGELGYEVYTDPASARPVYEAIHEAGRRWGLRNFGVRALNSLRLEKAYGAWGREYSQDVGPDAAGLGHLVRRNKGSFIGRDALPEAAQPPSRRLTLLQIDTTDVDCAGGEAVLFEGAAIARLTSGAHSYSFNCGLGLAYLPAADAGDRLEVEILGTRHRARPLVDAPYDPRGRRLRS
jgi:dimethylglycine dehydrogenase